MGCAAIQFLPHLKIPEPPLQRQLSAQLQSGGERLAFERQNSEDALMCEPQWFSSDKALERLDSRGLEWSALQSPNTVAPSEHLTCMDDPDETVESEKARAQELADALVEAVWNLGSGPMLLEVQYEGAVWEVSVKVKQNEG